jgi:hypothetical protein
MTIDDAQRPSPQLTLAEIEATWPPAVSVKTATTAFPFCLATSYALIKRGEFPAKTIKAGGRWLVITDSILASLRADAQSEAA